MSGPTHVALFKGKKYRPSFSKWMVLQIPLSHQKHQWYQCRAYMVYPYSENAIRIITKCELLSRMKTEIDAIVVRRLLLHKCQKRLKEFI